MTSPVDIRSIERLTRALELVAAELQVQSLSAHISDDQRERQQKDRQQALKHVKAYVDGKGPQHRDHV